MYFFLFFNYICLKYISCSNLQTHRERGNFLSWFNIFGCLPKPRQEGQEGREHKGQEIGGQEGQEETKTMRGKNTVYSRIIKVTYTPEPPKELRVYPTETELKFSICYSSGVKYGLNCSSRGLNSVLLIRLGLDLDLDLTKETSDKSKTRQYAQCTNTLSTDIYHYKENFFIYSRHYLLLFLFYQL